MGLRAHPAQGNRAYSALQAREVSALLSARTFGLVANSEGNLACRPSPQRLRWFPTQNRLSEPKRGGKWLAKGIISTVHCFQEENVTKFWWLVGGKMWWI